MKLKMKVQAALITATLLLAACATTDTSESGVPNNPETPSTETAETAVSKEEPKKEEPKDPPEVAFAKKLQAKLESRDIEGALALFDSIPDEIAGEKDMIFLHASLYISAGQLDKAAEIGAALEEQYPEDLEILEMNAIIAKNSGDKQKYKTYSSQILSLDPNNAAMNIETAQEYALNKKWKSARNAYNKALVKEPENTDALFGSGLMSFYLMEDSKAKDNFGKILEIDPENPMALCYMGKLAAEGENYSAAISYIERALASDDTNYDFYMDYGSYLHHQNKEIEAMEQWAKARDLDPDYFLAYAYLAGINDEHNNYETALENYRMVIKTNPNYYYAYESAAVLEWRAENWTAAREDFMRAFTTGGSTNWSYALMIAACYMKEGNQFKAKEFLGPFLKKMSKDTNEYLMVKFFYDNYSKNAANNLILKISREESSNKRGKLNFYFGLYNELMGSINAAQDYYSKVVAMQAPMFFEYRIAEWGMGL